MSRRIIVTAVGVCLAAIAIAAQLVALRGAAQQPQESRSFAVEADATGMLSLDLRATDGLVEVIGIDEDRVKITTEVSTPTEQRRWYQIQPAELSRAELITGRNGNVFTARVRVPGGGPVVEHWTVHVPRRFAVAVGANDGAFVVSDVSGGVMVRAKAGLGSKPGSIRVNVPGGRLDIGLGVGDIDVQTSSTSRGPVDVESSVGDARLTIAGRVIDSPRSPGPGHRLRLNDAGPDAVTLRVGVGTATLDIK